MNRHLLSTCAIGALACAVPANAQLLGTNVQPAPVATQELPSPTSDPAESAGPDIIVTGSLIRGTPENAALPVNVITDSELVRQGQPTAVELLKSLPTSSGVLGDANQFDSRSQASEGIASANLRGLGPQRTLVLLNSKRLVTAGNGTPAVDLNLLPSAAIGRIEVLKDGAAATYGSDAVAGVINFITRTDQKGLRLAANYRFIQDSRGDLDVSGSFGHVEDGFRFLVAAGFTHRGRVLVRDFDFALRPYTENPQGGWTQTGNPANFLGLSASGAPTTAIQGDTSCTPLGGYIAVNGRCFTRGTQFDALAEEEKRGSVYLDAEFQLTPSIEFQVTGLYGHSEVPRYLTTPSYALTQAPSTVALGGNPSPAVRGFYVPSSNPGFAAYAAANPGSLPTGTTGVVFPLLLYRPFIVGGNPAFLDGSESNGAGRGSRRSDSMRFTAELRGEVTSGVDFNVSLTHHEYDRFVGNNDALTDNVQLALRGLGGPNCNVAANTPGANGCLYLNPFGNAITTEAALGLNNPQGNAALANTAEVARWIYRPFFYTVNSKLTVAEGSVSGSTGIRLPGGDIRFALGGQYRRSAFRTRYSDLNNLDATPCRDTPITGQTNPAACAPIVAGGAPAPAAGALGFQGSNRNTSFSGDVSAVFAEIQLPILDSLNVQAAARYEDYGGQVGSTFNPQVRARWQITDFLAIRGGAGTTFRGPNPSDLSDERRTNLQLVGGGFIPVDQQGNPSLKPESSTNYSAGVLLESGGFNASVDYFRYDVSDVILADPLAAMVATLFPTGQANTCAANQALASRFTFTTGPCTTTTTAAAVTRVLTGLQNGASQRNSGIDIAASYRWRDFAGTGARLGLGVDATYTIDNQISAITVAGTQVASAYNGAGLLNYQTALYPVPEWKGQAYLDLGAGPVNARLVVTYIDGLHDQRADSLTGPFAPDASLGGISLMNGADIDEFVTADLNVQVAVTDGISLTGSVLNIFDRAPPFARENLNYEPFVANPFGRMFKVGVTAAF